jgi:hypothetical protein
VNDNLFEKLVRIHADFGKALGCIYELLDGQLPEDEEELVRMHLSRLELADDLVMEARDYFKNPHYA